MRHAYAIDPQKIGDKSMKDYMFFTVVRHPLERIVSTYRDKIMAWDHYRHWRDVVGYNPAQPFEVSPSLYSKYIGDFVLFFGVIHSPGT